MNFIIDTDCPIKILDFSWLNVQFYVKDHILYNEAPIERFLFQKLFEFAFYIIVIELLCKKSRITILSAILTLLFDATLFNIAGGKFHTKNWISTQFPRKEIWVIFEIDWEDLHTGFFEDKKSGRSNGFFKKSTENPPCSNIDVTNTGFCRLQVVENEFEIQHLDIPLTMLSPLA